MTKLERIYRDQRKKGERATHALHSARTLVEWDRLDGFVFDGDDHAKSAGPGDSIYCPGPIRLLVEYDEHPYDDSYIDTWTDIRESEREKWRANLWDRIERDGVVGLIGQYWNGDEWEHADSCWSFIGDDWRDSGYDTDIMAETIRAYQSHLTSMARALESTRPDLYDSTICA